MQRKAFVGWCNMHLRKKRYDPIEVNAVETSFDTGIKLMELINALYNVPFPKKYSKTPKMRMQKVDNLTHAFNMVAAAEITLRGTGTGNLLDHDLKMILGMIWVIILDYNVKGISVEELSAKEGLLLWCQRKTKGYDGVNVKNFYNSFNDGLALCALIHRHRPDLLDYDEVKSKDDAAYALETAFSVAEKDLDIPRLLDVEDMTSSSRVDEKAVICYVSEYFHKFSSMDQVETAGRRVGNLISITQQNKELQDAFENKAGAFKEWVDNKTDAHSQKDYADTHEGLRDQLADLRAYKRGEKAEKAGEKVEIESIYNNYQTRLRMQGRAPYQAAEGLSPAELDASWNNLNGVDRTRQVELRDELKRRLIDEQLLKRWASKTKRMHLRLDLLNEDTVEVVNDAKLGWNLETVLPSQEAFEGLEQEYASLSGLWNEIEALAAKIADRGLEITKYTHYTLDSIRAEYEAAGANVSEQKAAISDVVSLQQANDVLCKEFAQQANQFNDWVTERTADLNAELTGEPEEQLAAIQAKRNAIGEGEAMFAALGDANQRVEDAGILENQHTELEYEALASLYKHLDGIALQKIKTIQSTTGTQRAEVTDEQVNEFKEMFEHFDKDKSGALQNYEFASCLSALGHNVSGHELDAVIKKWDTTGDGKITFDEFVAFMIDQVQDVDSADQILQSFSVLAGGKDYVTEADLRSGKLSDEEISYCVANMPLYNGEEGCFDFKAFSQSVYA